MTHLRGCYGIQPVKPETLGQRIKAIRMSWGWTQRQLGEAINSNPKTVWHWEKGRQEPSDAALGALASLFGLSVTALRSGDGFAFPDPPRQMGSMLIAESYANDMVILPKDVPGGLQRIDKDSGECTVVSMTRMFDILRASRMEDRPIWVVVGSPRKLPSEP